MLKKLLKYDLKSVFKYWWIAAVALFGISLVGGFAIEILETEEEKIPDALYMVTTSFIPIIVIGFAAFLILTLVLVYVRFYKNFFSDEGYLTFTLPVKRTQLINSKLLMSGITSMATALVTVFCLGVMLVIGFHRDIFTPEFMKEIIDSINYVLKNLSWWTAVYALEAIALIVVLTVFSDLFLFNCITFASVIAKKARVITTFGIYYLASMVFSTFMTLFNLFGIETIISKLMDLPKNTVNPMIALVILGAIFLIALFDAILYVLQYWLLDRKLNLA